MIVHLNCLTLSILCPLKVVLMMKNAFDCILWVCVNLKQHPALPGTGHWPQGSDTPETSSFLTIKQNKNINTRTTRGRGWVQNSELRLFNCAAVDCGTLDPRKQRKIIYAICWELDTERKCDCVIFSSFNKSYFTQLQNSAKCLNDVRGLRSCSE